jgi:hypothetical protein
VQQQEPEDQAVVPDPQMEQRVEVAIPVAFMAVVVAARAMTVEFLRDAMVEMEPLLSSTAGQKITAMLHLR